MKVTKSHSFTTSSFLPLCFWTLSTHWHKTLPSTSGYYSQTFYALLVNKFCPNNDLSNLGFYNIAKKTKTSKMRFYQSLLKVIGRSCVTSKTILNRSSWDPCEERWWKPIIISLKLTRLSLFLSKARKRCFEYSAAFPVNKTQ